MPSPLLPVLLAGLAVLCLVLGGLVLVLLRRPRERGDAGLLQQQLLELRGRLDGLVTALMYVPAERVYYEAIVRDETLEGEESTLAYAMRARVIPVSPHTFYAYLSAVLHGLKGLQVEARAQELLGEIGTLAGSFGRFRAAYEKVGTHLPNAQKQYVESERLAGRLDDGFERLRRTDGVAASVAAPAVQGEGDAGPGPG